MHVKHGQYGDKLRNNGSGNVVSGERTPSMDRETLEQSFKKQMKTSNLLEKLDVHSKDIWGKFGVEIIKKKQSTGKFEGKRVRG